MRNLVPGVLLLLALLPGLTSRAAEPAPARPDWPSVLADRLRAAGDQAVIPGRDGWLFLTAELRHATVGPFWGDGAAAVSRATRPDWADPLPAILDTARQLRERGITLILAPIPPKCLIYPDALAPAGTPPPAPDSRPDAQHAAFYALLKVRAPELRVLDLTPALLAARAADPAPLYGLRDSHFSPRAAQLTARLLAAEIATLPGAGDWPRQAFGTRAGELVFTGDLAKLPGAPTGADTPETHAARLVGLAPDATTPLPADPASPVLLLGDSHALVFQAGGDMHGRGAGLADQLTAELGNAVEVLAVRGSGATPARLSLYRRAAADPAWLAGKRVVIWCFAAREFTEATGWRLLPIAPVPAPAP